VPVSGKPQSYEIRLEQKNQVITGSAWVGGRTATLRDASLRGTEIHFHFTIDVNGVPVRHEYAGKIESDAIIGTAALSGPRLQAQVEWNASRGTRAVASGASN
jgi:hypothetical protein